jgi:hypothetical protein
MTTPKRPLLTSETRKLLHQLALKAIDHTVEGSPQRSYAKGVLDTLTWLRGSDPTPLFEEVIR